MSVRILRGDALAMLRTLPDESVHICVTSPPYYGLRDYGIEGQMGSEPTPAEFIENMTAVFREVRRVLRDDGTCWVNMGDSYAGTGGQLPQRGKAFEGRTRQSENICQSNRYKGGMAKPKDLMGMPWRLAFALQDDGWYLRQDIIWSKPNPMPESVRDRCTKAHEYIFLLSKSERYFFDQDAIAEPCSPATHARLSQDVQSQIGSERAHAGGKTNGNMKAVGRGTGVGWGYATNEKPRTVGTSNAKQSDDPNVVDGEVSARFGRGPGWRRKLAEANSGTKNNASFDEAMAIMPETRNKRSVWTITTKGYSEAHFATFPPELPETCIKAGCPEGGTVLDPFFGAGTTGLVADRLQRNCIGIELNPAYADMAERRIRGDASLLAEVA